MVEGAWFAVRADLEKIVLYAPLRDEVLPLVQAPQADPRLKPRLIRLSQHTGVELGVDGLWKDARLDAAASRYAWCGWSAIWEAEPGEHELSCRATDANGETQPLEAQWDAAGFGNNAVQRLPVKVM